jgi:hypothetical protein
MKRSDHWVWLRNTFALTAVVVLIGFAAAPRVAAGCTGDCGNTGTVTVTDILTMVDIALGTAQLSTCTNGDANGDQVITVDEILQAVNNALAGCPAVCGDGIVEAGEDCDDGGTCIGGSNAGTHCTQESDCAGLGVCLGGDKPATNCDPTNPNACPSGSCKKCVPQGGDGCAANCTAETTVPMTFVPGVLNGKTRVKPGTSGSTVWNAVLGPLALTMTGGQTLAVGKERNNQIPFVVNAVNIDQINVANLSCACTRGVPDKTCGGELIEADGTTVTTDCSDGYTSGTCSGEDLRPCTTFSDCNGPNDVGCVGGYCSDCWTDSDCSPETCVVHACDGKNPCTYVHGLGGTCSVTTTQTCGPQSPCPSGETCVQNGVLSTGTISCVTGLSGTNMLMMEDSRRADGQEDPPACDYTSDTFVSGSTFPECASYPVITISDQNPAPVGAAQVLNSTAIGIYTGSCDPDDPNRPDNFCTDQEAYATRGSPNTLPGVTGSACSEIYNIFLAVGLQSYTVDGRAVCSCSDKKCSNNSSLSCTADSDCSGPTGTYCSWSYSCYIPSACTGNEVCCTGPLCVQGSPLPSCSQLTGPSPSVSGLGIAGAFTSPAGATVGDEAITDLLQAQ